MPNGDVQLGTPATYTPPDYPPELMEIYKNMSPEERKRFDEFYNSYKNMSPEERAKFADDIKNMPTTNPYNGDEIPGVAAMKENMLEALRYSEMAEGGTPMEKEEEAIEEMGKEHQEARDSWMENYENNPHYSNSDALRGMYEVATKFGGDVNELFTDTAKVIKDITGVTDENQLREMARGWKNTFAAYKVGEDTMKAFSEAMTEEKGNMDGVSDYIKESVTGLQGKYTGDTAKALEGLSEGYSEADAALSAVLALQTEGGRKAVKQYIDGADDITKYLREGGDSMVNSFILSTDVVKQGADKVKEVFKDGFSKEQAEFGKAQDVLSKGVSELKEIAGTGGEEILATQEIGAAEQQAAFSDLVTKIEDGTAKAEDYLRAGLEGKEQEVKDFIDTVKEGGRDIQEVIQEGMDFQQAGVGNMLDTIQQGTQGARDYLESSQKMKDAGALDVINRAKESGEDIQGIFGERFDTFSAGADKMESMAAEGKDITGRAEAGYAEAKETLREGLGRGLETYEAGIQKAEEGIGEGLDILKTRARRTTVPGQDILEGKLAAKTQEGVRQIKELGGGQGLAAISDLVSEEQESLRDLAIEGSRQRMVSEAELASGLMDAAQTKEGMYRGLGDAYTRAGSSMAGFESDITARMTAGERADLAQRLGVSQAGLELLGEGYLGMAGAADTAAARDIAASQYATGLKGGAYGDLANLALTGTAMETEAMRYGLGAAERGYMTEADAMARNLNLTAEAQRFGMGLTGEYDMALANQQMAEAGMMGEMGQYGINLTGQNYADRMNIQAQNLNRNIDVGRYATDAQYRAQVDYANMITGQTDRMAGAEERGYANYATALQAQGGAEAERARMLAGGAETSAMMKGGALTGYYDRLAAARGDMAGLYERQGLNVYDRESENARYLADLGMRGTGMAADARTNAAMFGADAATREAGMRMDYSRGLADLERQRGFAMTDLRGQIGERGIATETQAAQMEYGGMMTEAGFLGDYYNTLADEKRRQYEYNEFIPWQTKSSFLENEYRATDPRAYQMDYLGTRQGMDWALYNQNLARENAAMNSRNQMWGNVLTTAGTVIGGMYGGPAGAAVGGAAGRWAGNKATGGTEGNMTTNTGYSGVGINPYWPVNYGNYSGQGINYDSVGKYRFGQ
jgi:hypothetical protein